MSEAAKTSDMPPGLAQAAGAGSNRLGSTLFVAALAHGALILGVTFSAGLPEPGGEETAIKVTLLANDGRTSRPADDSEYIANRDSDGAGSVDGSRPATTLSSTDLASLEGFESATDLESAVALEAARPVEQLVTRDNAQRTVNATVNASDSVAERQMRQAALLERDERQTMAVEIRDEATVAQDSNESLRMAPSARASLLAEYLANWRNRVEQIGTSNFPRQFLREAGGGRPTVEVAIGADGSLAEVVIQRSSGSRGLDQAALGILRMAAPFEPLPAAILEETALLRFAYEWDFIEN